MRLWYNSQVICFLLFKGLCHENRSFRYKVVSQGNYIKILFNSSIVCE